MKDYIVTVGETYFDATKFDFNRFYIVAEDDVEYKCLLKSVEKDKATFITIIDGEYRKLYILPWKVKNGSIKIKEVETLDEVIPLSKDKSKSKSKSKYWDLYYNDAEMKVGKCYEVKIDEFTYKGFCSDRDSDNITMVLYRDLGAIAAITYSPTMCGKYSDDNKLIRFPIKPEIIDESITSGIVMKIGRNEIKEDCVYFKELV